MNDQTRKTAWCDETYATPRHERCPGVGQVPTGGFEMTTGSLRLQPVMETVPCQCECHAQGSLW